MKIIVDAFGCDNPEAFISGIPAAITESPSATLVVVGDKARIEAILDGKNFDKERLQIVDAPEVITNEDSPILAIRTKKNSSMVSSMRLLRDTEDAPVMITAGNTGATVAASVLLVGRYDRDDRPTLVTILPNDKGTFTCLADCGANVDCRPEHLVKFATYASDYMKSVYRIPSPRVALLSVGTEDEKGNAQTKEAFSLMRESGLNFAGNMEARTALSGDVDVIVADGFAGNILLKTVEGTAKSVVTRMVKMLGKHAGGQDISFVKSAVGELFRELDFNSMGGAIILGLKKPIIKAHGSANEMTMVNTVKQAVRIAEGQAGIVK